MLTPIRIFEGAFNGATVYSNPGTYLLLSMLVPALPVSVKEFVTPTAVRSAAKREKGEKYGHRKDAQAERGVRKDQRKLDEDELATSKVFA